MINKEDITKGDYDFIEGEANRYGVFSFDIGTKDDDGVVSVWRGLDDKNYDKATSLSQLITESLNVFSESNKTPRELLEENEKMVAGVKGAISRIDSCIVPGGTWNDEFNIIKDMLEQLIQKHKQ